MYTRLPCYTTIFGHLRTQTLRGYRKRYCMFRKRTVAWTAEQQECINPDHAFISPKFHAVSYRDIINTDFVLLHASVCYYPSHAHDQCFNLSFVISLGLLASTREQSLDALKCMICQLRVMLL